MADRSRGGLTITLRPRHGNVTKPSWPIAASATSNCSNSKKGRARLLRGAELTAARHKVGAAVCVHAKGMKEAWHLAASDATASASQIVNLYAKRWTIEPGFRDTKDLRFRMGLSVLRIGDPKHLGGPVIMPGGGPSLDGNRWIPASPASSSPCACCRACSAVSSSKGLAALHEAGRLAFFGDLAPLADKRAFDAALAPLRRSAWVVFAKRPFAGPQAVLAYLARYTHRDLERPADRARRGWRHLQL